MSRENSLTTPAGPVPSTPTDQAPVEVAPSSRPLLLVALGGGDEDAVLVRAAHRLAQREGARWRAIHLEDGPQGSAGHQGIERSFAQVARLAGETRVLKGRRRVAELLHYADEQRAATVMVGPSRPSGWQCWRRPLAERLLSAGAAFDLVVVAGARRSSSWPVTLTTRWRWPRLGLAAPLIAVASTLVALIAALGLESWLELANLSLLFLAAVLTSAALAGTRAAMLSAGLGFLAFNFFFTSPRLSLAMVEQEQLFTVIFFLIVALVVGHLAGSGRRRLIALRSSREQTHRLLTFARALSGATDRDQVGEIGVSTLADWLRAPVVLLELDDTEGLTICRAMPPAVRLEPDAEAAARWSWQQWQQSGSVIHQSDEHWPSLGWRFLLLGESSQRLGLIGLDLSARPLLSIDQQALLDTLLRQLALALQRTRLVEALEQARLSEEHERLRAALLSSVSHDLRTPLASVIGATSSLRDLDAQLTAQDKRELLDSILAESERLDRYIQNLLDMTRLDDGTLSIERDWISLGELLDGALKRLGPALEGLKVQRDWPLDLPLLNVHPALIEQALVNVLDNAARFSPQSGRLLIEGSHDPVTDTLMVAVSDEGPGIPPALRETVFDMFFTGGEGDRGRYGSGLGLAICRGMLNAHDGSIHAATGPAGEGTRIEMRLPLLVSEEPVSEKPVSKKVVSKKAVSKEGGAP